MKTNILEYLEATATRLPDKLAFSDGTHGMTFSEVLSASRLIGSALLSMEISHAPVAILMERHPHQLAAFYGCIYAGCFYIPLDAEMPAARMESILETVEARVIITDKKGRAIAERTGLSGTLLDYDTLVGAAENTEALAAIRYAQIDTDPIYVVFTSGSTGVPKGVVACHRSVIDYTEALTDALGFTEDTVFGNQTPLFFDAPLKELMPTLKLGATTYLIPKMLFSFPMALCNYLNEHRINTVCWVVSALTVISSLGVLESNPPKHLTTVAFGSEVFPLPQYKLWRETLPEARFFNLYGPTEATGMSTYWEAQRELEEGESIPVGRPFRNTHLFLWSEEGKEVKEIGVPGEIYLRGTCVTMGYFNQPDKSAEAFVQSPRQTAYPETVYRTGDLAFYNGHGELCFIGRKDAQIKHMGHRIELGEIESAAAELSGVLRACCVYHKATSRILLFYTGEAAPDALNAHLRERLPKYMLPSLCESVATLPLTPNGKLDRKAILESIKD